MKRSFRPPAVPLVAVDPYFSVWSMADRLYDDGTRHWTGKSNGMTGILFVDGYPMLFMGTMGAAFHGSLDTMEQKSVIVKPLSSIYTFQGRGVTLEVNFTTPLLIRELELLSRPASYVHFSVYADDGQSHDVKLYFDVTGEWCVHSPEQKVVWSRKLLAENISAMMMGSEEQAVLGQVGDDVRIDWGYFYLAVPGQGRVQTCIDSISIRESAVQTGSLPNSDSMDMPQAVGENPPVMACLLDFDTIGDTAQSRYLVLAYDDIDSVEYFHKPLQAYWRRDGLSMDEMVVKAVSEFDAVLKKCEEFNQELIHDGYKAGGQEYSDILALAYRQAIAAHKLVVGEKGEILFFSKECFSNGCMATVDVSYPSSPLFLLYNTELLKGMLRPVFTFAGSREWEFDFAPHDVGCYPKANGQVYGRKDNRQILKYQMPIEECGNMLIMTCAACLVDGDAGFAEENWEYLTKWAAYLLQNGLDPENQLCTDDFAGHLAHNANLSIKAILGIASYAILCNMQGKTEEGARYLDAAGDMASKWDEMDAAVDHYKLTFDSEGETWSQKYNLVWDVLFELHLFPSHIREKEIPYYLTRQNEYGLPLDSRKTYTKADWIVWSAALAESEKDFEEFIHLLWKFLNESPSRVPFTDWYDTVSGKCVGFRHRSVVGGMFLKLVKEKNIFSKKQ